MESPVPLDCWEKVSLLKKNFNLKIAWPLTSHLQATGQPNYDVLKKTSIRALKWIHLNIRLNLQLYYLKKIKTFFKAYLVWLFLGCYKLRIPYEQAQIYEGTTFFIISNRKVVNKISMYRLSKSTFSFLISKKNKMNIVQNRFLEGSNVYHYYYVLQILNKQQTNSTKTCHYPKRLLNIDQVDDS